MAERINNSRLETFCDGIFAIAITLLILEIKIPEVKPVDSVRNFKHELTSQWPSWSAFMLTFLTLFIAWVNHHHMVSQLDKTSPVFTYANGFLMLTVVVFPFTTGVLGRFLNTEFSTLAIVLYCLTTLVHNPGWLLVHIAATSPKDLTRDWVCRRKILRTKKLITYSCAFNFCVTMLAFWFPIVALCLVTSAWLFYLYAGITFSSIE